MKNKNGVINILMIVIIAILLAAAVGFYMVNQNNAEPTIVVVEETTPSYTLEDLASHDNESDCWMAVDGKVYDVTEYIASEEHPAGKAILKGCGLDASEMFAGPHSEETYANLLPEFEIGILK